MYLKYCLLAFLMCSLWVTGQSQNLLKEKAEVHIYAVPLTARTKFPVSKKYFRKIYEVHVFIDAPEEVEFIRKRVLNLIKSQPVTRGNIRAEVEIRTQFGFKKHIFVHQGGRISLGKYFCDEDTELINFLSDCLPKEYQLP
ncbi:MAG: hypothetical protein R3D00_16560 [Bacteroidia bacterium]